MLITETILSDFMNFFVAVLASTFGWNPNDNLLEYLVWDQLDYTKLKNLENLRNMAGKLQLFILPVKSISNTCFNWTW